ncbi:hypothetical protein AVEN_121188-1 [Araneus ventricosus]|uniref:Mos1 transposase HTH domain-containing protein n=1 Tax=Araneus ventricosus TaxID=182803 RepID=A0A4Y2KEE4_ARAVE|nr:hypothetical protein AVEN_121188-1 [Araneus ventricosus]
MSRRLQMSSKLELHEVSPFLWAKRRNCTYIYRQMHEEYEGNAISRRAIVKWCNMFENERINVDEAYCEGRPSSSTDAETDARVNEHVLANTRVTVDKIANELVISHGSVRKIVFKHLKFCKVYT